MAANDLKWKIVMRKGNWVYLGLTPKGKVEIGRITHVHPGDWEVALVAGDFVGTFSDLRTAKRALQVTWVLGGNL